MKIVHFLWSLGTGGAENLAVDLANLQADGNDVTLLIGNDETDNAVLARLSPAVRLLQLGRPRGSRNPYWMLRLLAMFRRLGPDIIHSHSRNLATLAPLIRRPMILTIHDVGGELQRSLLRYRAVCCISKAVQDDVRQRFPDLQTVRIDNGVPVTRIATMPCRPLSDILRCVQVGRLAHEIKGQDLLIRALAAINSGRSVPLLTADFIGDGPSRDFLIKLADELGVGSHCRFLGAMPRDVVYERLCEYDLLVQPSRYEGFGLTVAEGMAAGIPVLVSDIDGPMEIIQSGAYGYYFRKGDITSLTKALGRVISDIRSGTTQKFIVLARQHVMENYDSEIMAKQYLAAYRNSIDR